MGNSIFKTIHEQISILFALLNSIQQQLCHLNERIEALEHKSRSPSPTLRIRYQSPTLQNHLSFQSDRSESPSPTLRFRQLSHDQFEEL